MLPNPATLTAASDALNLMLPCVEPADGVLSRFFRAYPKLGARDRAFIAESAFGVLRHKRVLEALTPKPDGRSMLLAYLARIQGISLRQLAPLLRGQESALLGQVKSADLGALPRAVQLNLPDWLFEALQASMSAQDLDRLGLALQHPAPLDVRVNTLLAKREAVLAALAEEGLAAAATPYSPVGIRFKEKPALNRHPLFLSGQIEVQDEGSQILSYLLAPTRHDAVVDFCAGAGGKTLHLGAMMHSQGRLYAFDVSNKRLANLKPRLKRSGLSNIHPQVITHENDTRIKRLAGKIDKVLVDAPCSGLGTVRRNPDLKWRQNPESVAELGIKQAAILAAAARLLKPGGRLVYATCSLLQAENASIVDAFLHAHPEFKRMAAGEILAKQHIPLRLGEDLKLNPADHQTDGFFAAVLTRV